MQEVSSALRQMRFPQKLWYLLDLHTDAILWGGTGRTILLNYRVLHTYLQCNHSIFKTTNISSFVRQLNLYGFRKVTSHLQDPLCNSSNPYMHEYMHDYFQFDRPELLNKITRKALTMKKNFKVKNIFGNTDHLLNMTPLQKARRALQMALKKAVQNVYSQDSTKQFYQAEFDDEQEDFQDEESFDVDWIPGESPFKNTENNIQQAAIEKSATIDAKETHPIVETDSMVPQASLMHFSDDSNKQTNDNYPTHFLNMPDLDSEAIEENSGVELLAEFNINSNMDQGIIKKKNLKDSSLNCVLPSVSNDDISFIESNDDINHYNGEWDQMFSDIMTNKSSSQDSVSNLKELYSQISQTIDLLNS